MAKTILFATTNPNKLQEIKAIIPATFEVKSLQDIAWKEEIPEPFETFEKNAAAKTSFLLQATGLMCFAEDSGLEIDALEGRPGVLSARYAGNHGHSQRNLEKVLAEMKNINQRSARFISVIAFQPGPEDIYLFRGVVEGTIAEFPSGSGGFGYDPIFIPLGFDQPFAVLPTSLKNRISHRSKSMIQFLEFLAQKEHLLSTLQ